MARRTLAPRQLEVLSLLAVGHSASEVARRLGISTTTVYVVTHKAQRALGCATNFQLAVRLGRLIERRGTAGGRDEAAA